MSALVAVGDRDPISARAHHRGDWLCAKQEPGGLLTAQGFGRCSRPRGHQEPQHVVWSAETGRVLAAWAAHPVTELSTAEAATLERIEAAPYAPEAWNPTVYGIRPHRLITAEEDAMLRLAAESTPPIDRDTMLRQLGLLP